MAKKREKFKEELDNMECPSINNSVIKEFKELIKKK